MKEGRRPRTLRSVRIDGAGAGHGSCGRCRVGSGADCSAAAGAAGVHAGRSLCGRCQCEGGATRVEEAGGDLRLRRGAGVRVYGRGACTDTVVGRGRGRVRVGGVQPLLW